MAAPPSTRQGDTHTPPTPRPGYRLLPLPRARRAMSAFLEVARRTHMVHALVEVDVTLPRRLLREHRARTGEQLSFTAFVAAALAKAVDHDPTVQAYRQGRHLVVNDDVDVCVLVEHEDPDGARLATPHVLRAANRRTLADLHHELRAVQHTGTAAARRLETGGRLPGILLRWMWSLARRRPRAWTRVAGTVCITSLGMYGTGAGWGIPISGYTLQLTVGGIATRPGYAPGGAIEPREYLSLTVSVDHDIVDGAPAARFVRRLSALLEAGYALPGAPSTAPEP